MDITAFKGWTKVTLGDLGKFAKGSGITKVELVNEGLPCVRYGEIYTTHNYIIKEFKSFISKKSSSNAKKIKKNDILFAGSGETIEEIGKSVAYLGDEEAYAGGDVIIFTPTKEINSVYLSYFLNSSITLRQTRRLGQGHSVVHIYARDLSQLEILKPPLKQQQVISKILLQYEHAIQKTEQLIAAKERRLEAVEHSLLVAKKNKHHWETVILGGYIKERKEKSEKHNEFPVITSSRKGIYLQNEYFSKQVTSKNNSGYKVVRKQDFTFRSMSDDDLFVFNQLRGLDSAVTSPAYGVFYASGIDDRFLFYFLNSSIFKRILKRETQGGTRKALRLSTIKQISVDLPSLEEQKKIGQILDSLAEEIKLEWRRLDFIKKQKRGLMQKLLTGQWRIKGLGDFE